MSEFAQGWNYVWASFYGSWLQWAGFATAMTVYCLTIRFVYYKLWKQL